MTGIFGKKTPGNILMLLILGFLLKLPVFFHAHPPVPSAKDAVLYSGLLELLSAKGSSQPVIYALLAFLLHILIAFLLSNFINNGRLMAKANYLSGMAYLLISSLLPGFNLLSSTLLASVFLLASCILLFNAHGGKAARAAVFNAGLMVGIASLFHLPALFFLLWSLLALALLRPFQLSEWILLLLAAFIPYYFYGAALMMRDGLHIPEYMQHSPMVFHKIKYSFWQGAAICLLVLPLLAGIYTVHAQTGKMLVHIRKMWYLMLWYLAICFAISFFRILPSFENWVLMLVPIAAFQGYGYLNIGGRTIYTRILFWITFIFIIVSQYRGPGW